VNHLVFGIVPPGGFDVRQNGQTIHQAIQTGSANSLAFQAEGGGSFEIRSTDGSNPPPAAVTDLAAGSPTQTGITLTWTAVGADGGEGQASVYDIRYATTMLTTGNWGSAARVSGEPAPKIAGQPESFTVTGLTAGRTYYFAIKVGDEIPYWSALSNIASAATLPPPDTTPPAAVTTLAAGTPTSSGIRLTWTAVGDDNLSGQATSYDIRYSTSTITSGNWASATRVDGEPAPKAAGQSESFTVPGLTPGTTYYFAMKVSDEVPNEGAISNIPHATTLPPPDTTPPSAVGDLAGGSPMTTSVRLTWTAVGDDGLTGRAAAYDIRYSTSAITGANWGSATQVLGETIPKTSGQGEFHTVSGLTPGATYYFAIKVGDEVPNWSPLSNIASATTLPPDTVVPATVTTLAAGSPTLNNMTLTWIAVGDDGSTGQATEYDVRYSTTAITGANWGAATAAGGEPAPGQPGQPESFLVGGLLPGERYYFALKTRDEALNWSEISNVATERTLPAPDTAAPRPIDDLRAGDIGHRGIELLWTAPSDDSLSERVASYEGRYTTGALTAASWSTATPIEGLPVPAAPGQIERVSLSGLALGTSYSIGIRARDELGHLSDLAGVLHTATTSDPDTLPPDRITDLAFAGRTISSITVSWHAPSDRIPEDCIALPEVDRYEIRFATTPLTGAGWDAGTLVPGPDPESPGLSQQLTISGLQAGTRYYIALRSCDPRNNCSETSNQVEQSTVDSEPLPDTTPPGVAHGLTASAQGPGSILLTWTAPGGDGDQGRADHYDIRRGEAPVTSANWQSATPVTSEKQCAEAGVLESELVGGLPATTIVHFAIRAFDAAGNAGPISASVSDTTAAPPDTPDTIPPAAVADLGAVDADTASITLEWTTPADDRGLCAGYELRRSMVEIDATSWGQATPVAGLQPPGEPGTAASFMVEGLAPGTRYFFALRSTDFAGNPSSLSNIAEATTDDLPPPVDTTPPPAVTDLDATPLGSTEILLSWTAVEDAGGSGRGSAYEVRRSPAPTDSSNWDLATEVPVTFLPGAPPTTENLTVGGLLPATTYHFVVRVRDEAGNLSACSADVVATTPPIADTNPPAVPMGLSATADGDRVHVTWYASPEPDVVDYTVYRRAEEGSGIEPLTVSGLTTPAYEDADLLPDTDYFYSVAARDGSGNLSTTTAEVSVSLGMEGFLPIVTGYSAEATVTTLGSGRFSRVHLGWQAAVGERFDQFAVDRSTDDGSTWIRRATGLLVMKTGYEFEEEVTRGVYLYRIVAISSLGYERPFPSITVRATGRPTHHKIDGPFPNPSNGPLQITLTLADDARIQILAYDLQGRLCGVLRDDRAAAGVHPWSYDSTVLRDGPLASGVYFLRISIDEEQVVRKFVLEK
jgi:hypothetical protein